MTLEFRAIKGEQEIEDVYNYNSQAFSGILEKNWSMETLKEEVKSGWQLYAAVEEDQIVAALFIKKEEGALLTKNTSIKMGFQGKGHSHLIKQFYEDYAKENHLASIKSYCRQDDFRAISLNGTHGYVQKGNMMVGNCEILEWGKKNS